MVLLCILLGLKTPDQENINKNTKIPIDKIFLYHVEKQEDTR